MTKPVGKPVKIGSMCQPTSNHLVEGQGLKSDTKSAEKALSIFRKHPGGMSRNDCAMRFWKGLRKHSLCNCCLLPTWPMTLICGLNVNMGFSSD